MHHFSICRWSPLPSWLGEGKFHVQGKKLERAARIECECAHGLDHFRGSKLNNQLMTLGILCARKCPQPDGLFSGSVKRMLTDCFHDYTEQ